MALDGKGGHLALAPDLLRNPTDFTIGLWVFWNAESTNARIFDFGSNDIEYMALCPCTGDPYFNGRLQDLYICSGALTAAEIKVLAAAG